MINDYYYQAWNFHPDFGCNLKQVMIARIGWVSLNTQEIIKIFLNFDQAAVSRHRYVGWESGLREGCQTINPIHNNTGKEKP